MSGFENERYMIVFDGVWFELIEDWDFRPSFDIPMTETTGDIDLLKQRKRAFEFIADYIDIKEVISKFRVDLIKDELLVDTIQ